MNNAQYVPTCLNDWVLSPKGLTQHLQVQEKNYTVYFCLLLEVLVQNNFF